MQHNYTNSNFLLNAWKIEAWGELLDLFDYHNRIDDQVTINFTQALSQQQKTDLDAIMASHPVANLGLKIYSIAKEEAKQKHFHNLFYTIEIEPNLHPKRAFTFGVLNNIKWYSDGALTNLILEVDILYNYDGLGLVTDRIVTRKWYMENDNSHPDEKVTTKDYTINPQDQLDEAILRRTNNIRQTNLWLIGAVPGLTVADGTITDHTTIEIKDDGVAFFEKYELKKNKFVDVGSLELETAVKDEVDAQWDWFNTDATALGITAVSDVRDYIIYQLSSGVRNKNGDI